MKKIFVSLIVLTASAAAFAQSNGTVNLSKGQKYIVENKLTTQGSSEMQGQSMESNANITSIYTIEVKNVNGNNYNMVNSFSGIKMNMSMMGQNIDFDSDKKEDMDGEIGSRFKDYINQPMDVVMDKSANIIVADKKDTSKSNETAMMLKQWGSDPEAEGYGAKMAFFALPKKIKEGESWKDSTSKDGITKTTSYTVKKINGDSATVSIEGTENKNTKIEVQGMEVTTKSTGKFSGEEIINIKTGVIMQTNTTSDSSGSVTVMGQDVPMTTKVTSVTTVKPI